MTGSTNIRVYTLAAVLAVFVVVCCHERKLMLMCAVFWGVMFPLIAKGLQKTVSGEIEGYPTWSYYLCMVQQVILLILAFWMFLERSASTLPLSLWMESPWEPSMFLEEQVQALVLGAMIKDFILCTATDAAFILHHVCVVLGSVLCLSLPGGVGIVTINGVQAESFSLFYNLMAVFPSAMTKGLYVVLMPISNISGLVFGFLLLKVPMHWAWSATYAILCLLLVLFRCAGWGMYARKIFQDECEKQL
mmetsp:Transcript_83377/g.147021  ORF Transcript_83377/g.147021 Transcript_83377/m.147021 type:complete len:248 (-) Transcript_83377:44-787(-)